MLQFVGWLGISLISYVSLNLWYNQPQLSYVLHNVSQSLLGIALSWPLRLVFRSYWGASWTSRAAIISVSVLVFALAWAVIRLATFQAMTGEEGLWADFGGWYFPSIFIFGCWAAFYHGIKYYQLLQAERDQLLTAEATQKEQVLDVVVLGMGADGHTASLFPDAPQLKEGLNLANPAACLLVDPPAAPHRRVSLTLSKLLQAREIIVHITGEEKVSVIENAW